MVTKLINSQSVFDTFFNLNERWLDEEGYEDFNEYAKVMQTSVEKVVGAINNVVGTKRPFGIKFNKGDKKYKLFLRHKGGYRYCLVMGEIK